MSSRRKRWKAALPSRISSRCRCASRSDVFKYTKAEDVEKEYQAVLDELAKEVADADWKGGILNAEEYRTIQEVAGPLMLVQGVENGYL